MLHGLRTPSLWICQAALVALVLVAAMPDWRGLGTTLVLIASGGACWLVHGARLPDVGWAQKWLGAMVLFPAWVLGVELLRGNWRILEILEPEQRGVFFLGPLAAILLFLGLWRRSRSVRWFLWAVPMACVINGLYAIFQVWGLGLERAGGVTNAIVFSEITMMLTVLGVCLYPLMPGPRRFRLPLVVVGTVLGIYGCLLSGSRGSWIAGLVMGAMLIHQHRANRRIGLAYLAYLGGVLSLAWIPSVRDRLEAAFFGVRTWAELGHVRTPVGVRLEAWRASLQELFWEAPLLGQGYQGFRPALARLSEQGLVEKGLTWVAHAHNEWVQVLVEHGLLGVLALLVLYLGVWRALRQGLAARGSDAPELALALRLLGVGCLVYGLTDVLISNLATATFFCGMSAWLALLIGEPAGESGAS